jgi:hypothetical protein
LADRHRKVKCDEAKPGCSRCAKLNIVCSGYRIQEVKGGKRKHVTKSKQPLGIKPAWEKVILRGLFVPQVLAIGSGVENQYVQYFLSKTTGGFEGLMDWNLWK